jgi:hypothetical protein
MSLHRFGFTSKTVSRRSNISSEQQMVILHSVRAVEHDMYTAGVYVEEVDIDAEESLSFDEMVQMPTLGLEDAQMSLSLLPQFCR